MKRHGLKLIAAIGLGVPAAAAAEPVYFHKPNVERDAFEADLSECVELADGVQVRRQDVPYTPNIYAAAAGAFLAGFMASKERRQMTRNVLRTCMTAKGYRRIEATDAVSDELRKLDKAERAERLFTLAAAPQPQGRMLPQ
ncbi:MAG TPA: hypothetical protein VF718_06605 [Allosphingosinicella sp.]|jgi:hypothetical protein